MLLLYVLPAKKASVSHAPPQFIFAARAPFSDAAAARRTGSLSPHKSPFPPHTFRMGLIFLRTAIVFFALLIVMRLMGKRQIGEMQPFELVITLLIAELACIPMADTSIPLLYGIVSMLTIFLLHQIILILDLKVKPLKRIIGGKPSLVINKNGIDVSELERNDLDVTDLIESMRSMGYFSLDEVDYALYEANGQFTAMPRENSPKENKVSLPVLIVDDGKYDRHNLALTGTSEAFFEKILREQGVKKLKKVFVLTLDGTGKIYLQVRGEKYRSFRVTLPEGSAW